MDNHFQTCPPKMSDGRHFQDFKTATRRNEYIKYMNGIVRDDDYRLMLQKNSVNILQRTVDYHNANTRCYPHGCVHNYGTRTTPAEFVKEMEMYNALNDPRRQHLSKDMECKKRDDYKMSEY